MDFVPELFNVLKAAQIRHVSLHRLHLAQLAAESIHPWLGVLKVLQVGMENRFFCKYLGRNLVIINHTVCNRTKYHSSSYPILFDNSKTTHFSNIYRVVLFTSCSFVEMSFSRCRSSSKEDLASSAADKAADTWGGAELDAVNT